jgi:hypothetical protein
MAKYYEKQSKSQNAASLGSTHLAFHNNLLSIKSEGRSVLERITGDKVETVIDYHFANKIDIAELDRQANEYIERVVRM